MAITTTILNPDLVKDLINRSLLATNEAKALWTRVLWASFRPLLQEHWLLIIACLIFLFFFFSAKAYITGRWGSLGSFLYKLLYFGSILILVLIRGPEVLVSDAFSLVCAIILYPVCYKITGMILVKMGVRRRYR